MCFLIGNSYGILICVVTEVSRKNVFLGIGSRHVGMGVD